MSAGWTVPPLSGALRDGRLYGRGVSDMKGGLACSILAAALLAEHRDAWSGEVVLTLAGDEENMGSLGTGYLLEHIPEARGDANICGDVGSPMVVRFGEKGLLWIEVEATRCCCARRARAQGRQRHRPAARGARPGEAPGAAAGRGAGMPSPEPSRLRAPISEAISGVGESETLRRVTVNIGTIAGGVSPNLVPTHAIAKADIRLPVGISTAELRGSASTRRSSPLEGVTWRPLRRFEPNFTDPGHEIVTRVRDVAEEVLGTAPAVNMRVGGSDSRWYRMHDVPTVVYGLTPFNMGGPDEHILVDELRAVAKVHTLAAFDFLTNRT